VPAEYFLLTLTSPAELRALSGAHQKLIHDLMMRASWDTVHTFSQNVPPHRLAAMRLADGRRGAPASFKGYQGSCKQEGGKTELKKAA
jgi:hypothetical protein